MDRGWPDYRYLPPAGDRMFANDRKFVAENKAAGRFTTIRSAGGKYETDYAGRRPDPELPFEVRIVAVNDRGGR
jgi:hypothetical protein